MSKISFTIEEQNVLIEKLATIGIIADEVVGILTPKLRSKTALRRHWTIREKVKHWFYSVEDLFDDADLITRMEMIRRQAKEKRLSANKDMC